MPIWTRSRRFWNCPDVELANWLTGRKPIPLEVDSPMLRRIKGAAGEAAGR